VKTEREIELEKQVAALRSALEEFVTPNRGMGFGGMDRRFAEENARAVLADPNLGADWVPRAELAEQQRQYAENISGREQQHRAELRRVAEAVKAACVAAEVARLYGDMDDPARTVDLDAIVRGGK